MNLTTVPDQDSTELPLEVQEDIEQRAKKQAAEILKKNKVEIKRLKKLYEESLILGNKDSFIYALGKLRAIYKQPNENAILEYCWTTSNQVISEIIKNDTEKCEV